MTNKVLMIQQKMRQNHGNCAMIFATFSAHPILHNCEKSRGFSNCHVWVQGKKIKV